MQLKVNQIAQIINGKTIGNTNLIVRKIIIDSRLVSTSEGTLFIAIKGERHNGHNYILDLYKQKNIKIFLIEYIPESCKILTDVTFIIVKNSLFAFQQIAAHHRAQFNIPIIGITGSNGKTIVKEWLYHLLHHFFTITRSPKSYNSQTGVPLSVLNIDKDTQLGIFEAGISQLGEMTRLQAIIRPTIGIITNIGEAHQENFNSYEEKLDEKFNLFTHCNTLIYNKDYEIIHQKALDLNRKKSIKLFCWSKSKDANIIINSVVKYTHYSEIEVTYESNQYKFIIPFVDPASIENAITCFATAIYLNIPFEHIQQQIATLTPVAMRMEQIAGINECTIINDCYNADFESLSIALDFLMQQQHRNKILILSDILQSGKPDEVLYKQIANLVEEKKVNEIIGIGQRIYQWAKYFNINKEFYLTTEDFIQHFHPTKFIQAAILLKGARIFEFEKILSLLEQRLHRTVLEINMNALVHNLNYFRSKLQPNTKIMVMVKALSYGSGVYEIANLLEFHKVNYLAVAYTDEGITLRKAHIGLPIMVMSPEFDNFNYLIEYQLEPEIYSFETLEKFLETLTKQQISSYPIHIKLDTGMHRLGFMPEQIEALCNYLKNNPKLNVKSVFSHLAASDDIAHDNFTEKQINLFLSGCYQIQQTIGYSFDRHILNSAGIERFSQYQFEMVRLGIGLYGVSVLNKNNVQTVSTLKTRIIQIKKLKKGDNIGYGNKTLAENDMTIAILPIGYADGYTRRLSNKGKVWINGNYARIVGNICMDMCMIDVTNLPVKVNDEVELFGNHISIEELAEKTNTITYEILTSISERVKRIYIQE